MSENNKPKRRLTFKRVVLSSATITLLMFGRELYLAYTATPGSAQHLTEQARQLIASYQPTVGANGWDKLAAAVTLNREILLQHGDNDELLLAYEYLADPTSALYDDRETTPEEQIHLATQGIEAMRSTGVWDLLADFAASPRAIRPIDETDLHIIAPDRRAYTTLNQTTREFLSLSRALTAQMKLAHDAGDNAQAARSFNQLVSTAQATMHQSRHIDRFIGVAIYARATSELQSELLECPFDEEALVAIGQTLDRAKLCPVEMHLEIERLVALRLIQRSHTDNGHGNGRFIPTEIANALNTDPDPNDPPSKFDNLNARFMPSKKTVTNEINAVFDAIVEFANTPLRERAPLRKNLDHLIDQVDDRHLALNVLVAPLPVIAQSGDVIESMFAGTRAMVAIELYKARNGSYPQSLSDLKPDYVQTLPTDPFSPDGHFGYRKIDPTTDKHGRHYLLYSVGLDGTDDGGTIHLSTLFPDEPLWEHNHGAFNQDGFGCDYIINIPRPSLNTADEK